MGISIVSVDRWHKGYKGTELKGTIKNQSPGRYDLLFLHVPSNKGEKKTLIYAVEEETINVWKFLKS